MSNDKYRGIAKAFQGHYDSDEDLPEQDRKKIQDAPYTKQNKVREEAWSNQGLYPKLKRMVKGAWEQDIHKKK